MTDPSTKPPTSHENRQRFWCTRLRWWVFRNLPNLFESPDLKYDRKRHAARDDERNAKTTPHVDERAELYCLWAAEFYMPSHTNGLLSAFETLGWASSGQMLRESNPADWLLAKILGGGSLNLGMLVPLSKKDSHLVRTTPLPTNVDYAFAHLYRLSPSISCIVVCFVYSEEYSREFDNALRSKYNTIFKNAKHGHNINHPRYQKQKRILEIREDIYREARGWFARHLPGAFSGAQTQAYFMTCELIVLTDQSPSSDDSSPRTEPSGLHRRFLGVDEEWNSWDAVDVPSLKLTWPDNSNKTGCSRATLSIARTALEGLDMTTFGGHCKESYIFYLDEEMSF
jgi:hypothetical protein